MAIRSLDGPPDQPRDLDDVRISISSSVIPPANDVNTHVLFADSSPETLLDEVNNQFLPSRTQAAGQTKEPDHGDDKGDDADSITRRRVHVQSVSPLATIPSISSTPILPSRKREILIRKNRKLAQIFGAESRLSTPPLNSSSNTDQPRDSHSSRNEQIYLSPLAPNAASSYLKNQEVLPLGSLVSIVSSQYTGDSEVEGNGDQGRSISLPTSPLIESTSERRQKIYRLAKLHRHLGSGVPSERVLGITEYMRDLDLPSHSAATEDSRRRTSGDTRNSPSESRGLGPLGDDVPRLSESEKAANVRRASKMEKVCTYP
jgi:hypothetical protein